MSATGLTALIAGSAAIVLLVALSIAAAITGTVPDIAAIAAQIAAAASFFCLILAAVATGERDIYTSVPVAGMIVNGISLILYLLVFILGKV